MNIMHSNSHKGGQSLNATRTAATDTGIYRATVKRDAYSHQSVAKVERFDGTQWHVVLTRHIAEMNIHHWSHTSEEIDRWTRVAYGDCDSLIRAADDQTAVARRIAAATGVGAW